MAVMVPSIAEGFSIPVASAVRVGTPVVASDIPVHRELLGDGLWLAKPQEVEGLARALVDTIAAGEEISKAQRANLGDLADPDAVLLRLRGALRPFLAEPTAKRFSVGRRPRPRIALVSPLPPQQSGVADYTAFTFSYVREHADVSVFSAGAALLPSDGVEPISSAPYLEEEFDAIVAVVGNSHFHFPMMDLLGAFGGACIAHDDRMFESYLLDRGPVWTAGLIRSSARRVNPSEIPALVTDLDSLPTAGYRDLARHATPLIVHSRSLQLRIANETTTAPAFVPFVPYTPPDRQLGEESRRVARDTLAFRDDEVHLATFGGIDRRTKLTDMVVASVAWLRDWGDPRSAPRCGGLAAARARGAQALVSQFELEQFVTLRRPSERDDSPRPSPRGRPGIQLRSSSMLTLSGALMDCIAFGVPTVSTAPLVLEADAPDWIVGVPVELSSLTLAEAIFDLLRSSASTEIERETTRREYLDSRSSMRYAEQLLEALGLSK